MAVTSAPTHNDVLRAAARHALSPLGLSQKGRSRLWLDDRGWYLIVVEFQPSGWSKGSYLNVATMWLWHEDDAISFDYGGRVAGFQPADGEWSSAVQGLAGLAAKRVIQLRRELPDIRSVARALGRSPAPGWPTLNAALACALAGDDRKARSLADRLLATEATYDWQSRMHARMREYRALFGKDPALHARIENEVAECRRRHKLPDREVRIT